MKKRSVNIADDLWSSTPKSYRATPICSDKERKFSLNEVQMSKQNTPAEIQKNDFVMEMFSPLRTELPQKFSK